MISGRTGAIIRSGVAASILNPRIPPPDFAMGLAVHGDSLSIDQGGNNYTWVLERQIKSTQNKVPRVNQRGIFGISYNFAWSGAPFGYTGTMTSDGPTYIDSSLMMGLTNYLVVFAGTNGFAIAGDSAATEYANFKTYLAARIAGGWIANNIVVCTMLPRTGVVEATRTAFNTSLVGDDGGFGYRKARFDLDPNIGAAGQNLNTTYFYDGTHLTVAGHAIAGPIVYSAMFA